MQGGLGSLGGKGDRPCNEGLGRRGTCLDAVGTHRHKRAALLGSSNSLVQ